MSAKLFCLESFVPVTGPVVFIWENFHPVTEISDCDLGRKNRDLSNRASPASHMNTSIRPSTEDLPFKLKATKMIVGNCEKKIYLMKLGSSSSNSLEELIPYSYSYASHNNGRLIATNKV